MTIPKGYFDNLGFEILIHPRFPDFLGDLSDYVCVNAYQKGPKGIGVALFFLFPEHIDDRGFPHAIDNFLPNCPPPITYDDRDELIDFLFDAFFFHFGFNPKARKQLLIARESVLLEKGERCATIQ